MTGPNYSGLASRKNAGKRRVRSALERVHRCPGDPAAHQMAQPGEQAHARLRRQVGGAVTHAPRDSTRGLRRSKPEAEAVGGTR